MTGEEPRQYLNQKQLAEKYGVLNTRVFRSMEAEGTMMSPDVVIGTRFKGYTEERADDFGRYIKRMDEAGNPIPAPAGRPRKDEQQPLDARFTRIPVRYLGVGDLVTVTGLDSVTIFNRRQGDRWLNPDVLVGDIPGWDYLRLARFCRQEGIPVGPNPLDPKPKTDSTD